MIEKKVLLGAACAAALVCASVSGAQAQEKDFNDAWREMLDLKGRMQSDIRVLTEMVGAMEAVLAAHELEPRAPGYNALAMRPGVCREERMAVWCRTFYRRVGAVE